MTRNLHKFHIEIVLFPPFFLPFSQGFRCLDQFKGQRWWDAMGAMAPTLFEIITIGTHTFFWKILISFRKISDIDHEIGTKTGNGMWHPLFKSLNDDPEG